VKTFADFLPYCAVVLMSWSCPSDVLSLRTGHLLTSYPTEHCLWVCWYGFLLIYDLPMCWSPVPLILWCADLLSEPCVTRTVTT
jgi:hypothetical protein